MKTRNSCILSLAMSLMLLLSITSGAAGCSKTKKTNDKLIRNCQGAVEDYLVFLTSCKFSKLDRYCDPDDDPFQMKSAIEGFQQPLWESILSKTEFEIGDVEIDGDEAEVSVTLSLPDSKKILKSISDEITLSSVTDALDHSDKTTDVEVGIPLEIEDEKNITITGTDEIYEAVEEQYNILMDGIPDQSEAMLAKVDTFMGKFIEMDFYYVFEHAGIEVFNDYEEDYDQLYKTCMSFITYEIEPGSLIDEYTCTCLIHAHCKDFDEVASRFFIDPESLSPLVKTFLYSAIKDRFDPNADYVDQMNFDALIPGFRDALEASPDIDVVIPVTITVDSNDSESYRIDGDFSSITPPFDPWIYMEDLEDQDVYDLYRYAIQSLLDEGEITEDEYYHISLCLDDKIFDSADYREYFTSHGFEIQDDYGNSYLAIKGDTFWVSFVDAGDFPDSMYSAASNLEECKEGLSSGLYSGTLTGGWFDFTFEGQIPSSEVFPSDAGHEHEDYCDVYLHTYCVDDYVVIALIVDPTDEQMTEMHDILLEMGLERS